MTDVQTTVTVSLESSVENLSISSPSTSDPKENVAPEESSPSSVTTVDPIALARARAAAKAKGGKKKKTGNAAVLAAKKEAAKKKKAKGGSKKMSAKDFSTANYAAGAFAA
ncbi:hypothetical protein TrVE_jg13594 [Triparma verrucosa]|uniref:Uncharacterized protein n=1 Tax=Triparma verrucosa TaxID=1606542 RepID=A0A9W7BVS2_9STRA|nr:hypothetical protein TrVE_jg13594 [Triparma verrucosa]